MNREECHTAYSKVALREQSVTVRRRICRRLTLTVAATAMALTPIACAHQEPNPTTPKTSTPIITTVAGAGIAGYGGDNGPATSAQLNYPYGMGPDSSGTLYIADHNNQRVRKVTADGVITTAAGTGTAGYSGDNGPATSAQLNNPMGVEVDPAGILYIADYNNHRVRKVTADGMITTVAGTGTAGYSGDNGPATSAQLNFPNGLAIDSACANTTARRATPIEGRLREDCMSGSVGQREAADYYRPATSPDPTVIRGL
jgi:hypothetical protein